MSAARRNVVGVTSPTERLIGIQRMQRAGSGLLVAGASALPVGLWFLTTSPTGPLAGLVVASGLIAAGIDRLLTAHRRRQRFDAELEYELLSRPARLTSL
jgi:hypothetical protein